MNGPHLKPTSVAAGSVHDERIITWPISGKCANVAKVDGDAGRSAGS
jgi:hypothetical protein